MIVPIPRQVVAVACVGLLAACGGSPQQLHSDAEKAASVAAEAALLAHEAHAGRLTAPFLDVRRAELAADARAAASTLEQDQGGGGDRPALAADLRAVAEALGPLDPADLDRLAADAQRRQERL